MDNRIEKSLTNLPVRVEMSPSGRVCFLPAPKTQTAIYDDSLGLKISAATKRALGRMAAICNKDRALVEAYQEDYWKNQTDGLVWPSFIVAERYDLNPYSIRSLATTSDDVLTNIGGLGISELKNLRQKIAEYTQDLLK